ncbi:hypothetical protein OQA88_6577 [Cercophora sp. LCS_1]
MSGPRTKRPFAGAASDRSQRQITSFFKPGAPSAARPALGGPVLPDKVQSDLLSVGMRVRKSVVEGYKTDPGAYSAFALWSDNSNNNNADTTPTPSLHSSGGGLRNELVPYSGINKIGGMAVQPRPHREFVVSSQESISSTTSAMDAVDRTRKRSYTAEEEEHDVSRLHDGMWRTRQEWLDGEMSPRSFAPVGWGNARVLATPKTRVRGGTKAAEADVGQENVDDFEEATFLQEMDYE